MITLRNVCDLEGKKGTHTLFSKEHIDIDATGLTVMPALIDAHVHFRTPGMEHKENWISAARAALYGGITTVFDMPNTIPPTISIERIVEKKALIDKQIQESGVPLRYYLYLGADKAHLDEIKKAKDHVIGIKVFMGSSTGGLVMDDAVSLRKVFSLAADYDLIVSVHAEDEKLIEKRKKQYARERNPRVHSLIRSREGACMATKQAIDLARTYKTRLFLLHIGTKEELQLILQAKEEGLSVYAETTPHHLFLTEDAYDIWGTKVQMNPPLRQKEDCEALWQAIGDGIIDSIGSDHAPHTQEEKDQPYGKAPSGIPGVETTLPLLLHAHHEGRISLQKVVCLMKENLEKIFRLPPSDDVLLVDLNKKRQVEKHKLHTKCGWSPYEGQILQGVLSYVIAQGKIYDIR